MEVKLGDKVRVVRNLEGDGGEGFVGKQGVVVATHGRFVSVQFKPEDVTEFDDLVDYTGFFAEDELEVLKEEV